MEGKVKIESLMHVQKQARTHARTFEYTNMTLIRLAAIEGKESK